MFGIAQCCFGSETVFDDVVKHPSRFNHKRVTVRGLADVGGDEFALWRDARALKHADLKHYICIAVQFRRGATRNPYEYANLHFVKVTGVVDTDIHCFGGTDPFAIRLERVEVLPGKRLKEFLCVIGFFKNDTPQSIDIQMSWGEALLNLGPGEITSMAIRKGTTAALNRSGRRFAQCDLMSPQLGERYYDREIKAYYYRITKNSIEPVLPSDAKEWKRGYTYDRD